MGGKLGGDSQKQTALSYLLVHLAGFTLILGFTLVLFTGMRTRGLVGVARASGNREVSRLDLDCWDMGHKKLLWAMAG